MNIVNSQLCRILYFINTSRTSFTVVKDNSIQDSYVKSAYALSDLKLRAACYVHVWLDFMILEVFSNLNDSTILYGTSSTVAIVAVIWKIQQTDMA